jgi:hypothetical protein
MSDSCDEYSNSSVTSQRSLLPTGRVWESFFAAKSEVTNWLLETSSDKYTKFSRDDWWVWP